MSQNDELMHYGVMGMKWGHRKAYKLAVYNAKQAYKNRNSSIQKKYDIAEANIEKKYKRGQMLSKKDQNRELSADKKARSEWAKSKAIYKDEVRRAKNNYKSNVAKSKIEYKSNYKKLQEEDTIADKLLFNAATRKKAAQYMTENKMSMTEARKKARKQAIINTTAAMAIIGGKTLTELARSKLNNN